MKKVGVLGSGAVAQTLAAGFARHGYDVVIGSRDKAKVDGWARENRVKAGTFADAAKSGELIVLAVKGTAASDVLKLAGEGALGGKVVVDTCNPIADAPPVNGVLKFFTNLDESLMERLQKQVPKARFVKAFSSVGNALMVDPKLPARPTMFICGNDEAARNEVAKVLDEFGWETADMGKAEAARAIEPLCILWCIPGFLQNDWVHAFKLLRA